MSGVTGTWTEDWEVISENTELTKGDRVRIYFQIVSLVGLTELQISQINTKLEGNPDFRVLNHSWPDANNQMYWTVEVLHNPAITALYIALVITGTIALCWAFGPWLHAIAYERKVSAAVKAVEAGVTPDLIGEKSISDIGKIAAILLIGIIGFTYLSRAK